MTATIRKSLRYFGLSLVLLQWLAVSTAFAAQHEHASDEPEKLGTVRFATSCNPAV
jgi:hypothetical protein